MAKPKTKIPTTEFMDSGPPATGRFRNPPSDSFQRCSFCFYQTAKINKAKRECSQCDQLTLCLECSDKHVEISQHRMAPLGHSQREMCQKHNDLPRKLKNRCISCHQFLCDMCLAIGNHKNCITFELCAVGKDAMDQTRKMQQDTKRMLSSVIPKEEFDKITAEATELMKGISESGFQLIQNIQLLYDQQMKSAARQRDDLLKRVAAASDYTEVATGRYGRNTIDSDTILKHLREKLKACPVHGGYTEPEKISMGHLYQDDDVAAATYVNLRTIPPVPPRRASSATTPTTPDDVCSSRRFPEPTHEQYTVPNDITRGRLTQDESDTSTSEYTSLLQTAQQVQDACPSIGHPAPTQAEDGTEKSPEEDPIFYEESLPSTVETSTPATPTNPDVTCYTLEDCVKGSWTFLPKCRNVFSLAMLSLSRFALLTSKSRNPMEDLADSITVFNADGTSMYTIAVHRGRRLTASRSGDMVLLQTEPPSIRALQDSPSNLIIDHLDIERLHSPQSMDVDVNGNYCIIHGPQKEAKLTIMQPSGTIVTSIEIGDSRYVNCTGTTRQNMTCMFTVSRTAVTSYAWNELCLDRTKSIDHHLPMEIFGSCCNELGDLFVIGVLMKTEKPRECCLYQFFETDSGRNPSRMQRLDDGSMKYSGQEPRISYCNGHILIVLKEGTSVYDTRMFKLNPLRD